MTHHVFNEIEVTPEQVVNACYSNWSKLFPSNVGKAKVFKPLPKEFIQYLESDSIRLPKDRYDEGVTANSDNEYSDWDEEEEEEEEDKDSDDEVRNDRNANPVAGFEDLHLLITKAVADLGGSVTPKLNWSSPKDAKWILPNSSTRCFSANDIYLLLNSSDHIVHDIDHAFDECAGSSDFRKPPFELVLKQWVDINPALEFRVFVKSNTIVAISQRDLNFYDYLDSLKPKLFDIITDYVEEHVISTYPDESFIVDVYLPRPFEKVWIIDINAFSRTSDLLLFTWNEITEFSEGDEVEMRLVTKHNVGRFASKEHSENYVPRDIVDASLDSSAMADLAREWQKLN